MKNSSIKELLEFSILNIDKPSGPTSYQVSDYVREKLGLRKTSHMGTLDPAVSGVLPITLNRACKLSPYLMKRDKKYVGIMRLHEEVSDSDLNKVISSSVGKIMQRPPMRSNVKRVERPRLVKSFDILERDGKDVLFETDVEAGTYIRTLVHDMGEKIGGAHMLELRRTRAGSFNEKESISLYEFDKAVNDYKSGRESDLKNMLISAEKVIENNFPIIKISDERLKEILTGKPIHKRDIIKMPDAEVGEIVGVFFDKRFVEMAKLVFEGDVVAKPEFVFN